MIPYLKKKKFLVIGIAIVFILIVGGIFAKFGNNTSKIEYTTSVVERGNITQTVSATGSLESAKQIDLAFQISGTVQEVYVEVGDEVKKGDILALLDTTDLANQLNQASANLASAVATLEQLQAGASDEDIAVAEQNLESARVAYESSLQNLENVILQTEQDILIAEQKIDSAEQDLKSAQNNLQNVINTQGQNIDSYENTALTLMDNHYFIAKKSLEVVDDILNHSDHPEILGIQNSSTVAVAQNSYRTAESSSCSVALAVDIAQATQEYRDIVAALDVVIDWLGSVSVALDDTLDVLLATPGSANYTESEISADKASVQTEQSTISNSTSTLLTAKSNLVNANTSQQQVIDDAAKAVTSAENALDATMRNYDLAVSTRQARIDTAKAEVDARSVALNVSQAQLDLKKAKPREVDLASSRASVSRLSAVRDDAVHQLEKTRLLAPIDGVVSEIFHEVGEQALSSSTFLTMLTSFEYQIEVDISEADIAKVNIDDSVSMSFDAFGVDREFVGRVFFIDPAETVIQDVVYYEVNIELSQIDSAIKPGMTVNVDILTDEKEDVLFIPQRAVVFDGNKNLVRVLKNGTEVEEREVTVGIRGDEGVIQITSGLSEGEEVITFIKEPEES
ncbi:MAG TPA: efflux RND transporter periplasmic adaptor subunit [Patescibacteria group bacterium]|nr:efflux RND transporter periplasmic adaptor subunit [Patescibacteria group bacterium]